MASFATRACCDVTRWLTFSRRTIMASCTACDYASMVHQRTSKRCGRFMASLTTHIGLYVSRRFAFSTSAVMASCATRGYACMTECGRNPCSSAVASIA